MKKLLLVIAALVSIGLFATPKAEAFVGISIGGGDGTDGQASSAVTFAGNGGTSRWGGGGRGGAGGGLPGTAYGSGGGGGYNGTCLGGPGQAGIVTLEY